MSSNHFSRTPGRFLFLSGIQIVLLIGIARSQELVKIPEYFIRIQDDSETLREKIATVQRRFNKNHDGRRFWVGYRFQLREGTELDRIYIKNNGGVTFTSRKGGFQFYGEDDLETHALHALSELGDEKAKKELRRRQRKLMDYVRNNWGFFMLFDARILEVQKIRLLYYRGKRVFDDHPVFWLDHLDNEASFHYLKEVIENDGYPGKVIKPAILVLSLHEQCKVIPFLTEIAGGDRYIEIRKSAAFWLGQIPEETSLRALVRLFEKEETLEMKENLVFAMGQHESKEAVGQLAKIAYDEKKLRLREKAVFWLGQVDGEESLDVLVDLLSQTRETKLKEKIVFSLSQHDSDRSASVLIDLAKNERNREVRKKAIFWLGQLAGRKTLQVLGDIVEDDDETEIKTKAVFAISQHQDTDLAFDMLMNIAKNNPNPHVRKKAIFWMGQIGDDRAVDFFKDILIKNN